MLLESLDSTHRVATEKLMKKFHPKKLADQVMVVTGATSDLVLIGAGAAMAALLRR